MPAKLTLKEQIQSCTECQLYKVGNGPVPYVGRPSPIMIVGEAPGRTEDELGRPFVGPAGKFLFAELAKVGITRKECFIANAVCCYPAGTPTEGQIYACRGNLYKQVKRADPSHILAVGKTANWSFHARGRIPMGKLHGNPYPFPWFDRSTGEEIEIFPTYHPAAVLRNGALTRAFREDLRAFAEEVTNA